MKPASEDCEYIKSQHFLGNWKEVDKLFPGGCNSVYIPSMKKVLVLNCHHEETGQVVDAFVDICHSVPEVFYLKSKNKAHRIPPNLINFTATLMIDKVVVYGGSLGPNGKQSGDLYSFDLRTHQWEEVRVLGDIPLARDSHAAVHYGDGILLVFGDTLRLEQRKRSNIKMNQVPSNNNAHSDVKSNNSNNNKTTSESKGKKRRKLDQNGNISKDDLNDTEEMETEGKQSIDNEQEKKKEELSLNDAIHLTEINKEEDEDSNIYDENIEQVEKLADNFEFYGANVTDKGVE